MILDMTFCSNMNCRNKECKRNQIHLIEMPFEKLISKNISIANFEDCEKWRIE